MLIKFEECILFDENSMEKIKVGDYVKWQHTTANMRKIVLVKDPNMIVPFQEWLGKDYFIYATNEIEKMIEIFEV